jgi:hypothetical protein
MSMRSGKDDLARLRNIKANLYVNTILIETMAYALEIREVIVKDTTVCRWSTVCLLFTYHRAIVADNRYDDLLSWTPSKGCTETRSTDRNIYRIYSCCQ